MRAALGAVLAGGGPRDPERRAEAIIDGPTLSILIGADAAALGPWPRLHVADHFGHALALVDEPQTGRGSDKRIGTICERVNPRLA